jgi:mannosidase alpha-like ER degradation enhancer 1
MQSYEFILSSSGMAVEEDINPSLDKIARVPDGWILFNLTGVRTVIKRRESGTGYDITRGKISSVFHVCFLSSRHRFVVGQYSIERGQTVYVNDSTIVLGKRETKNRPVEREPSTQLRFFVRTVDAALSPQIGHTQSNTHVTAMAYTSTFGGDINLKEPTTNAPLRFSDPHGVRVTWDVENPYGCAPYSARHDDAAILTSRGECSFLEKLTSAREAGAAGVVVVNHEDQLVNPSAAVGDVLQAGDLSGVAIVVLTRADGKRVVDLADSIVDAEGQLMVMVDTETSERATTQRETGETLNRILYLNGYPLLNTKLLV